MEILLLNFFLILGATVVTTDAQESYSTAVPETFIYEWIGEEMTMQIYFILFLKPGPERSQNSEEAARLKDL
ncbi:hypothetical protein [Rhodohalobacter sp.]|uniref:hypothetical protein n=1 Tax=Rhodohalobacter sp. TaxID=1974210 RepID=UPI003561922F